MEEIVKALEICTTTDADMDCSDDCPMYEADSCVRKLLKLSYDLIHRLQDEKEHLIEELDFYKGANIELAGRNETLINEFKSDYKTSWKNKFFTALKEKEELQKQVDEAKECIELANKSLEVNNKRYEEKLEQAVKDTAKEIYQEAKNIYDNDSRCEGWFDESPFGIQFKWFIESKGVEVEL